MIELARLEKYDRSGMHKVYDNWAKTAIESYESKLAPVDFKDIEQVVIAGMWLILKEYFKQNNINSWDVFSEKGNILSKLINLIYFFDYTTIYNAIIKGIDPSSIRSIDFIKSKLN